MKDNVIPIGKHHRDAVMKLRSISSDTNTPADQKRRASYELFYRYYRLIFSNNELSDAEKVTAVERMYHEISTALNHE